MPDIIGDLNFLGVTQTLLDGGSVGNPAYTFRDDVDTGMYQNAAGQINFSTNGTLRFTINSEGALEIPNVTAPGVTTNKLYAAGGNLFWNAVQLDAVAGVTFPLTAPDGTIGAPSYSFSNDTDMGIIRSGSNLLGLVAEGFERLRIGGITDNAFHFYGQNTTNASEIRIYENRLDTSNYIGFTVADNAVTSNDIYTLPQFPASDGYVLASTTAGIMSWSEPSTLLSFPLLAPAGLVTAPSYSFAGDTDTGIYQSSAALVSFASNGQLQMTVGLSEITVSHPVRTNLSGTATAPIFSKTDDTNTGMYFPAADTIGFTIGGTLTFEVNANEVDSTVPFRTNAGSVSAPAYSFRNAADQDDGMYHPAASSLAFAVQGKRRVQILNTGLQVFGFNTSFGAEFSLYEGDPGTEFVKIKVADSLSVSTTYTLPSNLPTTSGQVLSSSTGGLMSWTDNTSFPLEGSDGSAAAPTYSFSNGPDLGVYRPSAGTMAFAASGIKAGEITQNGMRSVDGLVASPSISFINDTDTGVYLSGTNELSFATNAAQRLTIESDGTLNVAGTTNYEALVTNDDDIPNKKYVDDAVTGISYPLTAPDGSAGAPSYSFSSATNTGVWYSASSLNLAVGGGTRLAVTLNGAQAIDGSAAGPGYAFLNDTNTGMYRVTTDTIGFSAGNGLRMSISSTEIVSTEPFRGPDGASVTPTYSFASDNNSGMYSSGADEITLVVGNNENVVLSSSALTPSVPIRAINGTSLAPAYSFDLVGADDTGMYLASGGGNLGFSSNGTITVIFGSTLIETEVPVNIDNDGSLGTPAIGWGTTGSGSEHGFYVSTNNSIMKINDLPRWTFASSGLLTSSVTNYETLVLADDDIPNKKYVDDAVSGAGGISNVVEDLTPQLGGDLDTFGKNFTNSSTSLQDIGITAGTNTSGLGGNVDITGGAAGASAGDDSGRVQLFTTDGESTSGQAGSVEVETGDSYDNTGQAGSFLVTLGDILGAPATNENGSNMVFSTGNTTATNASSKGGDVTFLFGRDTAAGNSANDTYGHLKLRRKTTGGNDFGPMIEIDVGGSANPTAIVSIGAVTNGGTAKSYFFDSVSDSDGIMRYKSDGTLTSVSGARLTDTALYPDSDNTLSLGLLSRHWTDGFFNGTVEAGEFVFNDDTNTGMIQVSADVIGFKTIGGTRVEIDSTQMRGINGTAALPGYSFRSDPNSGMYRVGSDEIAFSTNATARLNIESNGTLNVAGTTDYETLVTDDDDIPNKKYVDDTSGASFPLFAPSGTAADPSYAFSTGDSGIYAQGTGSTQQIHFSSGNQSVMFLNSSGKALIGNGSTQSVGTETLKVHGSSNTEILIQPQNATGGHAALELRSFLSPNTANWTLYTAPTILSRALVLRNGGTGGAVHTLFETDGTISVNAATAYETLVTSDNDIPNKKYVDDNFLQNLDEDLSPQLGANLDANTFTVTGLPTTPSGANDAASKAYVDSLAAGFDPKESCRVGTTVDLDSVGNGTWVQAGSGVGATLTAGSVGTTTLDGVVLADGDRVLVKDQGTTTENGIYTASSTGAGVATVLTRSTDQDGSPASEVSGGNFTFVEQGTANVGKSYSVVADGEVTVDTDPLIWTIVSGPLSSFPLLAPLGSESAPSYSFFGDDNTGMYSEGPDQLTFTVGGSDGMTLSSAGLLTVNNEIQAPTGSPTDPSYTFTASPSTGMYYIADSKIGFSTGNIPTFELGLTYGQLYGWTVGAGSLRFTEAPNFGGTHYVSLEANQDLSVTTTYILPTAYPAGNGYVMTSSTTGGMAWVNPETIGPIQTGTIQTTTASVTTALQRVIASDTVSTFTMRGHGFEPATGDTYSAVIHGCIKNAGGTTSLLGALQKTEFDEAGSTAWDITVVASDTADAIRVNVTGEAAHTIDWTVRIFFVEG